MTGFSRPAGAADVSFSYTTETGDEFYVGETEMALTDPPLPYSEISRRSYSVFVGLGVTDNLDVTLNLPYVATSSNYTDGIPSPVTRALPASQENVQNGALKVSWRAARASVGPGAASITVALRGSTPLSEYKNGENLVVFQTPNGQMMAPNLVVIGDRASAVRGGGLLQYRFDSGVFTSVQVGYQLTGASGGLDVPNKVFLGGRLGYAGSRVYGEAWVGRSASTSGPDIGEDPRFPLHDVDFTRLGASASGRSWRRCG
ncbi:MAG: hypothetical protein ABEL97_07520 [Salinibacter sp.]